MPREQRNFQRNTGLKHQNYHVWRKQRPHCQKKHAHVLLTSHHKHHATQRKRKALAKHKTDTKRNNVSRELALKIGFTLCKRSFTFQPTHWRSVLNQCIGYKGLYGLDLNLTSSHLSYSHVDVYETYTRPSASLPVETNSSVRKEHSVGFNCNAGFKHFDLIGVDVLFHVICVQFLYPFEIYNLMFVCKNVYHAIQLLQKREKCLTNLFAKDNFESYWYAVKRSVLWYKRREAEIFAKKRNCVRWAQNNNMFWSGLEQIVSCFINRYLEQKKRRMIHFDDSKASFAEIDLTPLSSQDLDNSSESSSDTLDVMYLLANKNKVYTLDCIRYLIIQWLQLCVGDEYRNGKGKENGHSVDFVIRCDVKFRKVFELILDPDMLSKLTELAHGAKGNHLRLFDSKDQGLIMISVRNRFTYSWKSTGGISFQEKKC